MNADIPYNERRLIEKLAADDEPAFNSIFRRYRANIYTTALHMTGSVTIAEEVVQDVFLKLWKGRKEALLIVSLKAYLHGIAQHVIYDALKRKYREKEQRKVVAPVALFHNDTENEIIYRDYQKTLNYAINRLPDKQRQTYVLIKQEGFKRKEVAKQLNVSPETVKWNLEQAIRSVRAYCSDKLGIKILLVLIFFI